MNETLEGLKKEEKLKIQSRYKDGILEKENADFLTRLIDEAQNKGDVLKISALGTTLKRTGFHFDTRLEKMDRTIKYLKGNEQLSFNGGGGGEALTHKLIIGDNYPALLNLLISYRKKIKVIYIDPPYGKDDMGEFAKTNYDNAISRDNLLSMLYSRLCLARELLKDDGVIFCSIDDRNQAYVKCLFDEVFGEGNFVSSFVWQKKSGGGQAKFFYEGHEYVLIYTKNKNHFEGLFKSKDKSHVVTDFLRKVHGKYTNNPKLKELYKKYPNNLIEHRNLMFEEMDIFLKENMITLQKYNEIKENINNGTYFLKKFNDNFNLVCKYNDDNQILMYSILSGDWTSDGNNENEDIFVNNNFRDPKPVNFMKTLIQSVTINNNRLNCEQDIILDFFAGSGTTAHAVMELNREDGGKRQFILITNNEKNIAIDVTSKRLKRIMSGECYDGSKDFRWLEKNEPYGDNLEVLEIEKIADSNKKIFDEIDEKLYGKDFEHLHEKIEWVCENFELTCKKLGDDE